MNPTESIFDQLRPRLFGIAYRMLGVAADAEDVVQDAWLRWRETEVSELRSAEAWLVTIVTRLAIDRLRSVKTERESYIGTWLAEPLVADSPMPPDLALEMADDMSMALLAVLERLTAEERAAFLLREVFDTDYADVAATLGKNEAACRQLVHRAKTRVRETRPRFAVPRSEHLRLIEQFAAAARRGDIHEISALFTDDAVLISDGGGKVSSFLKGIRGARRLAQLYFAVARRSLIGSSGPIRLEIVDVNGTPGILRFIGGKLESVQTFDIEDGRISAVYAQRNPDKLANISVSH